MTKIRKIEATIHHTESNTKELKMLTCFFTDRNEKYVITKVFVVEFSQELLFDVEMNEFLIAD